MDWRLSYVIFLYFPPLPITKLDSYQVHGQQRHVCKNARVLCFTGKWWTKRTQGWLSGTKTLTSGVMVDWVSLDGTDMVRWCLMLFVRPPLVQRSQGDLTMQLLLIFFCKCLVFLYSKVIISGLVRVVCLLPTASLSHMVALLEIPSSKDEEFKPTGKISNTQHMGLTLLLSAAPGEPEKNSDFLVPS